MSFGSIVPILKRRSLRNFASQISAVVLGFILDESGDKILDESGQPLLEE